MVQKYIKCKNCRYERDDGTMEITQQFEVDEEELFDYEVQSYEIFR